MPQELSNSASAAKSVLKSLLVSSALALSAIGFTYCLGEKDHREGILLAAGVMTILAAGHVFIFANKRKTWQERKKPIVQIKDTQQKH
jgi:prophage maintenance system killer protein